MKAGKGHPVDFQILQRSYQYFYYILYVVFHFVLPRIFALMYLTFISAAQDLDLTLY